MHIEHVAIWVKDLEKMKAFYEKQFNVSSSELYYNPNTQFQSYFLTFETGSRLELMTKPFLASRAVDIFGYAHLAIAVGGKSDVDAFVEKLVSEKYPLLNGPRMTGDGYYEAVVQDPEGNLIELTTDLESFID